MTEETSIVKHILKYEDIWCNTLGIFNPYLDPYKIHFTRNLPMYDSQAYKKYPRHNFVYDKLFIAKTQNIQCGELEHIGKRKDVKYPIFIKPRWGHKSASSKNCFKIKKFDDLLPHLDIEDMIWTEFIDARETMTDFLMVNGKIMYQMTSVYSDKQNGFIDDWKYISPKNKPPEHIVKWVEKYMKQYTGICNVQYRGNIIIEVSLRLSRGGCYIKSTDNTKLIKQINNIIDDGRWDYTYTNDSLDYKPFYSFKCYTSVFIVYLLPQHLIDIIMKASGSKSFYEYFFEPSGKTGMVFFQFLHNDFKKGMQTKVFIERLMNFMQLFFILTVFGIIFMIMYYPKFKYRSYVIYTVLILYLLRFINPLSTNYSLYKAQKQQIWG